MVPFRSRGAGSDSRARHSCAQRREPPLPSPEGLERYEGGEQDDGYRHRMLVNLAAFVFTIGLAAAGIWLAVEISDLRHAQDCYVSGRRNCAPIDVSAVAR